METEDSKMKTSWSDAEKVTIDKRVWSKFVDMAIYYTRSDKA